MLKTKELSVWGAVECRLTITITKKIIIAEIIRKALTSSVNYQ